jgi:TetR/AcrR family transcriptional regulator, cholesterol catabolism regulator
LAKIAEATRRRAIEDVASDLFRERGYAATSVRDIARALSMQGPSLYAHVTSKEAVLAAIVERAAGEFEAAADTAERAVDARNGDAVAALEALIRAHVRVVAGDVGQASVFVHEWRALAGERRAAILARRDAYEARFRRRIGEGIAVGAFALGDPALAATVLLSAMNAIATWYDPRGRLGPDRLADHFVDYGLRMVGGDSR